MTSLFLKGVAMNAAVTSAAPKDQIQASGYTQQHLKSIRRWGWAGNAQTSSGVLVVRYIFNHDPGPHDPTPFLGGDPSCCDNAATLVQSLGLQFLKRVQITSA